MQRILISTVALLCLVPAARAQAYGDPNSLVDYWYRTYLGRAPDPAMAGWANALNQGTPADQVLAGILASNEFYSRAGSTPAGYINLLCTYLLQRQPTPSELNFWVRRMYTENRQAIAEALLTQNPGVWVGSSPAVNPPAVVTPPIVVTPGVEWNRYHEWNRDRRSDWDRHHNIHEYRRPDINVHRNEHHDHRR